MTVCKSLSPRPDRLTIIDWSLLMVLASFNAYAIFKSKILRTKTKLSAVAVKPPTLGGGYKATHTL